MCACRLLFVLPTAQRLRLRLTSTLVDLIGLRDFFWADVERGATSDVTGMNTSY